MKNLLYIGIIFLIILGCASPKPTSDKTFSKEEKPVLKDTVRIANDELEYEIIIFDPGFNSWFATNARPRNYYSQSYLEARNQVWVIGWNNYARRGHRLFEMQIDYENNINYGYEVNYMLFNYLTYFQLSNNIKLGSFAPRI